jgi:hypothetical protein
MKKFYGLLKGTLWYVSDTLPVDRSYITLYAETRQDAERQLFEMTGV